MQGKGHGEKLGRKQELVIAALLECPTYAGAAAQAGVSEVTVWRWLQDTDFAAAYREARTQVVDQAIAHLQKATGQAVSTLEAVMGDAEAPPSSRVAAAKTVLDLALKIRESEDLEARLLTLETLVAGIAPAGPRAVNR